MIQAEIRDKKLLFSGDLYCHDSRFIKLHWISHCTSGYRSLGKQHLRTHIRLRKGGGGAQYGVVSRAITASVISEEVISSNPGRHVAYQHPHGVANGEGYPSSVPDTAY